MSEFMLLFKGGDPVSRKLSPEEMEKHMQKWGVWMKSLGERGHFKGGSPLDIEGKLVKSPKVVTDGPFAEAKDLIGGYIMVEAKDLDEAARLAQDCPIFEDGQNLTDKNAPTVEVRPVKKMDL
jgi:hypothetical protein